MFISRSAPQPAMRKTPTGGTGGAGVSSLVGKTELRRWEGAYGRL